MSGYQKYVCGCMTFVSTWEVSVYTLLCVCAKYCEVCVVPVVNLKCVFGLRVYVRMKCVCDLCVSVKCLCVMCV